MNLRKRAIIESVNNVLKNDCQIEYSRYKYFDKFIGYLIARLIAYSFFCQKYL